MGVSMNIHPKEKWESVKAELFGEKDGCAIMLWFTDDEGKEFQPALHFGSMKNANEFIGMLKDAIKKLPETCESCGRKKEE